MHDVLKEPDVQHKRKKASGTKIFEHANLIFLWAKLTEICLPSSLVGNILNSDIARYVWFITLIAKSVKTSMICISKI